MRCPKQLFLNLQLRLHSLALPGIIHISPWSGTLILPARHNLSLRMVGGNVENGGPVDAEAIEGTVPNPALAAATALDVTSSYRSRATREN